MFAAPAPPTGKNILPNIKYISLSQWPLGVYSRFDEDLTPQNAIRIGENVWLDQNGTLTPRPGLTLYGTQPLGPVLGQIFEYVAINTSVTPNVPETWLICMQVISGNGVVCINKDGGAWQQVSGKVYSATAKAHFEQIFGRVLITNGVDTFSYMDIVAQTITVMSALAQPSAPSANATGVGGTVYNLRYRITAANQGETAGSPAAVIGISQLRETWNGTSQYVTFTWVRIAGAERYNIYVGDQSGFEYYLDTVADTSINGSSQQYVDTGSIAVTATRVCPVADSTAGPKTTRAVNIKGQVFMTGDNDNPYRVWFGGNISSSALDFSSYNGGGWVEPDKGSKNLPVKAIPFRDGHGTPMVAVLAKGTNGAGKRYLFSPATTTLGSTVITYMAVQEDSGWDGTDSPDGVVFLNDALWYPSRVGFKSTLTLPQVQNILSTETVTNNIAPDVLALSSKYMDACVGLAYDQRIYWALPSAGSTVNNQIWIMDMRPPFNGAWIRPWYINCDWLTLYGDNSDGKTKLLMLVDNQIYQLDPTAATNDNGVTFQTNIGTGAIKFSDDEALWASVIDVTFVFLRPQGNVNMSVNANTEDGVVVYGDTMNETSVQGVSGFGQYGWGAAGWGNLSPYASPLKPKTSIPRKQWTVPVDEECNKLTCGVNSTDPGVQYQLAEVVIRYVPIGWKDIDN